MADTCAQHPNTRPGAGTEVTEPREHAERRDRYAEALYNTLEETPAQHPWATLSPFRRRVWYDRADAAIALADAEQATPPPAATTCGDTCGETTTGMFGADLGPCIREPRHRTDWHHDARGAEWRWHQQPYAEVCAERDQLQRAVDAVRRLNQLTADSCRVQAAEHARDNLTLLDSILPPAPARTEQH